MKISNSSSLQARIDFNEDDEGELHSDSLGTMNRGCSVSIFLLSLALWKDLNPGCKITTLATAMCGVYILSIGNPR